MSKRSAYEPIGFKKIPKEEIHAAIIKRLETKCAELEERTKCPCLCQDFCLLESVQLSNAELEKSNAMLREFKEGQWWVNELDALQDSGKLTDDAKRAIAVVHRLLKTISVSPETWFAEQLAENRKKVLLELAVLADKAIPKQFPHLTGHISNAELRVMAQNKEVTK